LRKPTFITAWYAKLRLAHQYTVVQKLDELRQHRGKALLGHLNITVNLMIKPAPSEWIAPLEAITMKNGDCKAYSLAKY